MRLEYLLKARIGPRYLRRIVATHGGVGEISRFGIRRAQPIDNARSGPVRQFAGFIGVGDRNGTVAEIGVATCRANPSPHIQGVRVVRIENNCRIKIRERKSVPRLSITVVKNPALQIQSDIRRGRDQRRITVANRRRHRDVGRSQGCLDWRSVWRNRRSTCRRDIHWWLWYDSLLLRYDSLLLRVIRTDLRRRRSICIDDLRVVDKCATACNSAPREATTQQPATQQPASQQATSQQASA